MSRRSVHNLNVSLVVFLRARRSLPDGARGGGRAGATSGRSARPCAGCAPSGAPHFPYAWSSARRLGAVPNPQPGPQPSPSQARAQPQPGPARPSPSPGPSQDPAPAQAQPWPQHQRSPSPSPSPSPLRANRGAHLLAAIHFDGLPAGLATNEAALADEERTASAGGGAAAADDAIEETLAEPGEEAVAASGAEWGAESAAQVYHANRSAAGRSGRFRCLSGLVRNPTVRMAVGEGTAADAAHTLLVAPATGPVDRLLVGYTSRDRRRPAREPRGVPRAFMETPGRSYLHVSHPDHRKMHQPGTATAARGAAVAASRCRLLLFLSAIGLVPPPDAHGVSESQGLGMPGAAATTTTARQSRRDERSPSAPTGAGEARRARAARVAHRSAAHRWGDAGAARTALRTWEAFRLSQTRAEALRALASLKGYYVNYYPSPLHKDSDDHLESCTLRWLGAGEAAAEAAAVGNAGGTVLPFRGLAIFTRASRDVTHLYFKDEEHAAWDGGGEAGGGRGRQTAFHLQSGGASRKRVRAVCEWVARAQTGV